MPAKTIRPAATYIEFLGLATKARQRASLPALDPLEESILTTIALAGYKGDRLSVRDMMTKSEHGSPATVHGRLVSLREKGWIELQETDDARRKQVALTDAALRHFDRLSRCMLEVADAAYEAPRPRG